MDHYIPTDIIQTICSFLGGCYISFAPVSKRFYTSYILSGLDKNTICITPNTTIEFLSFAISTGLEINTSLSSNIAKHGSLDLMKFVIEHGCPWDVYECIEYAIDRNKIEILDWIYSGEKRYSHFSLLDKASRIGNIEILKWAVDKWGERCDWNMSCIYAAHCVKKNPEILKWIIKNGCPWDDLVTYYFVVNNNFEMLKWCLDNGCPWYEETSISYRLTKKKNYTKLKWVIENGCPWDPKVFNKLLQREDFEMLKWAVDNGCPWDYDINLYNIKDKKLVEWFIKKK